MEVKRKSFKELQAKANHIRAELQRATCLHEQLRMQIASQSDPAWVEMVMMKRLGMVPSGQVKIYFDEHAGTQ